MRSHLFGVSAGALLLGAAGLVIADDGGSGSVGELIANPGFENPALDDGQWNTEIVGWTTSGVVGTWNPTTVQFPSETLQGENVAWIAAGTDGSISQVVGEWAENEYYVLSYQYPHGHWEILDFGGRDLDEIEPLAVLCGIRILEGRGAKYARFLNVEGRATWRSWGNAVSGVQDRILAVGPRVRDWLGSVALNRPHLCRATVL